jgi:hypothetical protein
MTLPGQISGPKELARFVDYFLLHPDVTKDELTRVCASARELGLGGICVHTSRLAQAYHLLEDSGVKIIAAIGFPFGAADSDAKRYESGSRGRQRRAFHRSGGEYWPHQGRRSRIRVARGFAISLKLPMNGR